ncbi:MAG: PilZ domain-containing protein [Bryobacteraceae bacterium]
MADNSVRLGDRVERRTSKRFPIEQELTYRTLDRKAGITEAGAGRTIDFSSAGIFFETPQRLHSGRRVEVSVMWPAVLDGGCPLKFVALGRVVRADDTKAAVSIEQYEFRTRRGKETSAAPPEGNIDTVPYH